MLINIQPLLENEKVILYPLQDIDFEDLYSAASDPKIWEPILSVELSEASLRIQ